MYIAAVLSIVAHVVSQGHAQNAGIGMVSTDGMTGTSRTCLSNAILPELRRDLRGDTGNFPLGLWSLFGSKLELDTPSTIFKILAEEVLGYNVLANVQNIGTAAEALWKVAGCQVPNDPDSCYGETRFHVTFGVTFSLNVSVEFSRVQRLQMGGLLENLASMGYLTRSGIYVTESLLQSAEFASNRSLLDDYRSYDAHYHSPQQFFSDLQSIDSSRLVDCSTWLSSLSARACENNWWKAPSCRHKGNSSCIPCLTASVGGVAYRATEVMQKAVSHKMPLALGVTPSIKDLHDLVERHRTLFVFWEPDVTFLLLRPKRIAFPKHNPAEWLAGDYSTASEAQDPRIVVSTDLMRLAPDARELLQRMKWSLADIDFMMHEGVAQQALQDGFAMVNVSDMLEAELNSGHWIANAAWEGACQWLENNRNIWNTWIPQADRCLHGQGMWSDRDGWLEVRQVGAVCRSCEPGTFSMMVTFAPTSPEAPPVDTAICRLCSPGRKQYSWNAQSCDECPAGTVSGAFGSTECTKCSIGTFQNQTGQSSCISCPENMDTAIKGATSEAQCNCRQDTYWHSALLACVPCPPEFICNGSFAPPLQKEGHWAEEQGGYYSVYYCRDVRRCPQGYPGQCQTGRTGRACADCYKGHAAAIDGSCQPCDAATLWPFIVFPLVIMALVPILILASIAMSRARRVAVSVFVVCLIFGQLVVCLQSLEAIYQFDILWVDPAKAVLSSLAIFSLDIEFSCVLPPRSHLVEYASQLLAYPAVLVGTFLLWSMVRCTRKRVTFTAFVNLHGIVLVALLTAMSLTVLRPFQCQQNPNGLATVATRTDVVCWTTAEHMALVGLACLGILAYPVAILSAISFLTWKYPIWLRSSSGLEVLERYKFLFGRFRPERYYYGLLLSAHNLVVALIPAALVSVPALQVGIMGIVVCVKLTTQSLLWPWRVDVANYNDMILSAGLLILLLLASPLLNLNEQKAMEFVAVLLACVMFILPVAALLAASAAVCFRLRPQSKYSMFLCHHKAGAGALCRFIKLIVHKYGRMNIFLDSDELDDLSRIFEIVGSDTRCLVAVLTPELLQRMWCAGEMTSARKTGIPIVPLYCDGFAFPDAESINKIESVWTEEQQYTLTSHGISMEDIKAAYIHIRTLTFVTLRRSDSLEEQERAVLRLMLAVSPGSAQMQVAPQGSISNARVLVCSSEVEPEFVSTRLLLQQMIQKHLQIAVFSVQCSADIPAASKASFVVVLLSRGALQDPTFAKLALAIRSEGIEFVPVNDGSFQFPSPEFYRKVEGGDVAITGLEPDAGPTLAKAYQALLSILALPFAPHGSSGILDRQVAQICQRFGNLEDLPQKRTTSPQLADVDPSNGNSPVASLSLPSPASADADDLSSSDDALCV